MEREMEKHPAKMCSSKYETIFGRSFSKHEQKKMGCGAVVASLIIAFTLCTVFKPYLAPLPPLLNLKLSVGAGLKMLMTEEISSPRPLLDVETRQIVKPICNTSEARSDVCEMRGDIRIQGNSTTILVALGSNLNAIKTLTNTNSIGSSWPGTWRIRPYARKTDLTAMGSVREFTVQMVTDQFGELPICTHNHSVPGILFSTSGYVGNYFHEFTDILIPLYLTSHKFGGQVEFLVTNKRTCWINKYKELLGKLSKFEIIDIDRYQVSHVHCFPRMVVGLRKHKELTIDPSRSPYHYSMANFREFLREVYSLKREKAIKLQMMTMNGATPKSRKPPRLLIISRKRTRSFMNEDEIVKMARSLGFQVVMTEANSHVAKFAELVNSCDVIMGVHGAGLTNMIFLPENAVVVQILPLGAMEWLARTYFGDPAKDMNLRYLEYKIELEESSLAQEYPPDHPIFRDPISINKQGWLAYRAIYLEKQNVKLKVDRFRATLLQALELLHY